MNQSLIRATGPAWGPTRQTHKFQLAVPQSCAAESEKVLNLRRELAELESHLIEIDKLESRMEFLSMGKLAASFVSETCIGFLDLAASILDVVPGMAKAKQVAKGGVTSIRFTQDAMDYGSGQITGKQMIFRATNHGMSVANADTMMVKTALRKAETTLGAVGVAMGETGGLDYVKDESRGNFGLATDGLKDALGDKAKAVRVMKGLQALDGVIKAGLDYNDSLDKVFDTRLQEMTETREMAFRMRTNARQMIRLMKLRQQEAVDNLNACIQAADRPTMSPVS